MLFRRTDVWETGVKMADVFYKILQMSISASWLILAIVVLRIFLKKVPRKIICFLWALVAIRLVCPFAIESRFSLIPDTQGIFADYENQLENAGTDNVNAGLQDMSGAVGGALDNEGAAGGNADMASGKLNNEIDNAAGNITAGNTAGGNITGGSVSDGGIAAGNIADKNNMSGNMTYGNAATGSITDGDIVDGNINAGNIPNLSSGNDMQGGTADRVNNGGLNDISGGNFKGNLDNADNNLSGAATSDNQKAAAGNPGYTAILAGKLGGISLGRLAFIWTAGCVILLLYTVGAYILLRRKTGAAFNNGENIYICDDIDTPFILGIFSPKIYIPSLLTEEERGYVIAHEKAHLKRLDCVWKPLGFILLAVYWFNPLSWVAYILLCRDIELACDERVIADKDIEYKKQYAMTLLNCSSPKKMVSACPLAFGEVSVKTRIKTVLNYKKPAFWLVLAAIAACVVVMVCFMTNPKSSAPDNESVAGENIDESSSAEPDSEKLVAEGGSEVINNNGWSVWFEAVPGYSFSNDGDSIDIINDATGERSFIYSYEIPQPLGTYDDLKHNDTPGKWGMALSGTLEEYIDGEVGVTIYNYNKMISPAENQEPGEGYFIVFGSPESDTVWMMMLPVGSTRAEADELIKAVHLELSKVLAYDGWQVWVDAVPGYSFSNNEDSIGITDEKSAETFFLSSHKMSDGFGTYDELKANEKLKLWGTQLRSGTFEEYIDGEVGVSVYKYDETSASGTDAAGEGYFLIFGSSRNGTVWMLKLPAGGTREEADKFIKAVHLKLDCKGDANHIDYEGWNIEYVSQNNWKGSCSDNVLNITNTEDSRSLSLIPYDESGNMYGYNYRRNEVSLLLWKIDNLIGYRNKSLRTNENYIRDIYYYEDNEVSDNKEYIVMYSAVESDIIWYIRFINDYSLDDVYDIIDGINITSADALATWDGKLRYYDSKLPLTIYEQYERAGDRLNFLDANVTDDIVNPVKVFDLLAEELKDGNPELYEKLKNPVSSGQALLEINYTSYKVYNYYSDFDDKIKVVEYTLDDGSLRAIKLEYRDANGLWMPAYEYDVDSSGYESIVLVNKYMDGITADRLKQVTQIWTGVSEMGDTIFDVSDNYVILDSVADSDIVLYGMYGGLTMVIRDGEHVIPVWTNWMSPHMVMPQIHYGDYDNDGAYEYAIWSNMDTGTGVSGDELYIIEADYAKENSEEDFYSIKEYSDWGGDLDNAVSYYLDDTGNIVTMTLNGEDVASVDLSGHFEEHKEYNESFDGIDFGSHYSFHEQDGIWYFVNAGRIYVKRDGKSVYDEDMIPYNVVVNARVVYEPDQQFHLEDIEIIVEERNN